MRRRMPTHTRLKAVETVKIGPEGDVPAISQGLAQGKSTCGSGDGLSIRMYATYLATSADQNMTFLVSDQPSDRFENIGVKLMPSGDCIMYLQAENGRKTSNQHDIGQF